MNTCKDHYADLSQTLFCCCSRLNHILVTTLILNLIDGFYLPKVLLHVLFEHAAGYALFAVKEVEEIGMLLPQVGPLFLQFFASLHISARGVKITDCVFLQVEESVLSIAKFNSMVSLAAFFPFKSAQAALENINAISEGKWTISF